MSSGGAKNSSTRLLPPIKNPLFNPHEDSEEVRVTSVNSHVERTRPGRRLGGLSNLFSSRNRHRFSPSSDGREEHVQEQAGEGVSGSSMKPTVLAKGKATKTSNLENRGIVVTPELSHQDTGSETQKTVNNRRVPSSQNRFSRNLSNNTTEANVTSDSNNREEDFPLSNESKGGVKGRVSEEKNSSGLLRRGKEKRSLVKQDSEDSSRLTQSERLGSNSASDSEVIVRGSHSRREDKKKPERKYHNAMSLRSDWREATASGDYQSLLEFLTRTFDSFSELVSVFKRKDDYDPEEFSESGIDYDFVRITYEIVLSLPQDVQKNVLKSVINSLLQDIKRKRTKNDLRAYIILLQNPQFNKSATYVIFAHLLRQVSSLADGEHQFLVHWFRRIPVNTFKGLITRVQQFISVRLFPANINDLPSEEKCTWWIPSAVKVLALLNASNWLFTPPLVNHTYFYNQSLDHIDLMSEYYSWQNPGANPGKFSFCQYPFILSLAAKRFIMQKDSESQMIVMARKSLVAKVQRREMPDMGMLFLNIKVRRSNLISDSLNEISRKQRDLKKKLKVTFAGEPGLDMGGLTKEWFLLLVRKIFRPEYGMFTYNEKSRTYWFSKTCMDNDSEFNLVGVLMGLAVYNSIILDIRFPPCCYKKLLSPAVVPFRDPHATVGIAPLGLKDLMEAMPDLGRGLKELLEYEGDVEEDLCQTFQISYTVFGEVITHSLKPRGDRIPVTKQNRQEYVNLYVDYLLNRSIYQQFASFYHGFHSVCASNALIMLRPEEVEMLVCGNPELDMDALRKVTVYEGCTKNDPTVRYFWDVVLSFSLDLKKKLLLFATGSDRVPIGGMGEMEFKIIRMEVPNSTSMLPMAHTCFNQLCLPPYKSRKILKQKLTIAISNAEGFGIE
ncbi:probable E3 ubiquitin-protein ligase HECTD2 [Porites lutea]|uniref:probable E3 ubiquitin-protein ligase HECTD2 n=1 Tax=Porites lutea TaxID=51062 RepID=UPI003CC69B95